MSFAFCKKNRSLPTEKKLTEQFALDRRNYCYIIVMINCKSYNQVVQLYIASTILQSYEISRYRFCGRAAVSLCKNKLNIYV